MSKIKCNEIETIDGTQTLQVGALGLGLTGETWVNETDNREIGIEYTNTEGKSIMVVIVVLPGADGKVDTNLRVNEYTLSKVRIAETVETTNQYTLTAIIPDGSTYELTNYADRAVIDQWKELK